MSQREINNQVNQWLRCVRAEVVGQKRRAVYQTIPLTWIEPVNQMDIPAPSIENEDVVVVEIPTRELEAMGKTQDWYKQNIGGFKIEKLDRMIRNEHIEENLRSIHPGLQEAWEQYQILLALTKK